MEVMKQSVAVSVILCPAGFTTRAAIWNDVPNVDRDWFPVVVGKGRVGSAIHKKREEKQILSVLRIELP